MEALHAPRISAMRGLEHKYQPTCHSERYIPTGYSEQSVYSFNLYFVALHSQHKATTNLLPSLKFGNYVVQRFSTEEEREEGENETMA